MFDLGSGVQKMSLIWNPQSLRRQLVFQLIGQLFGLQMLIIIPLRSRLIFLQMYFLVHLTVKNSKLFDSGHIQQRQLANLCIGDAGAKYSVIFLCGKKC